MASYSFADPEETYIRLIRDDGSRAIFPAVRTCEYYERFLETGQTAAPFIPPDEPPESTAEEKLANAGLTVEELKGLLGLN